MGELKDSGQQMFDGQVAADAARRILPEASGQPPTITEQQPQTEILKKQAWHQQVEQDVEYAKVAGESLTVLLMDIDGFKGVNDDFSHEEGDRVIAETASLIHSVCEELGIDINVGLSPAENDKDEYVPQSESPQLSKKPISGHIGGDEFAVLSHCNQKEARKIKDEIKKRFTEFLERPENAHLKGIGIGLAIGIGELQPDGSKSNMLRVADEEMYADKIENLPTLNDDQKRELRTIQYLAAQANIRLRDLPKYLKALEQSDKS